MFFQSNNFIREYQNTDKFITIQYPNGIRYHIINVCQYKKAVLNKSTIRVYTEGNDAIQINFNNGADAKTAFQLLNNAIDVLKTNCSTSNTPNVSTDSFLKVIKDPEITEEHIGLLAMQYVTVLNDPPMSLNDFETKAKIATTSPPEPGTKAIIDLNFTGNFIFEKPPTTIIRLSFSADDINVIRGYKLIFYSNNIPLADYYFYLPAENTGWISIGATLYDTINNIVDYFNTNNPIITRIVNTYNPQVKDPTEQRYIDFEMLWGEVDTIKYIEYSTIGLDGPTSFNNTLAIASNVTMYDSLQDTYSNVIPIIIDSNVNVDGYRPVTFGVSTGFICADSPGTIFFYDNDSSFYKKINSGYLLINPQNITRNELGQVIFHEQIWNDSLTDVPVFPRWAVPSAIFTNIDNLQTNQHNYANYLKSLSETANYYIRGASWDTQQTERELITYNKLFVESNGQIYGSSGPFGLRYFSNETEVSNAITWALNNQLDSGLVNWFNIMFDVITPLSYDVNMNRYSMTVQSKTAPGASADIYFNTYSYFNIYADAQITQPAISGKPERIKYQILGRIAGIDGMYVLIDKGFNLELKMASVSEGTDLGTITWFEDLFHDHSHVVLAWRNGKVIDFDSFQQIMQNSGFSGEAAIWPFFVVGGIFVPLTPAGPDMNIIVTNKQINLN